MNSKPSLLELVCRKLCEVDGEDPDQDWGSVIGGEHTLRKAWTDYDTEARAVLETILSHLSPESRATLEKELGQ